MRQRAARRPRRRVRSPARPVRTPGLRGGRPTSLRCAAHDRCAAETPFNRVMARSGREHVRHSLVELVEATATGFGRLNQSSQSMPWRSAQRAACVRSVTPIRWNVEVRCALTVRSLMPSRRAICLLARPLPHQAQHFGLPLGQVDVSPLGCCLVRAVSSWRAARGCNGDSPRAAARTPSSRSSGSVSLSR